MIKTFVYRDLTWIDIESPTVDDISSIIKKYSLHPLVGEELVSPSRKPKVDAYKDYLFLALHIPIRVHKENKQMIKQREIDFVIGAKFIITAHYEPVEPLYNFAKAFETNSILDKLDNIGIGDHALVIFYYIMKRLYDHMGNDLENIKNALSTAEKHIFSGHERKMVQVLSELSREIIDFKQTARLHKEVLESFSSVPLTFLGKDSNHFLEDIKLSYDSIHELMLVNHELVGDLRETNDSLLSARQNENLKLFSILAFVTFPLALLLDIFSLPTSHVPIIGYQYDWEIITGTVLVLAIGMFFFFKRKGW